MVLIHERGLVMKKNVVMSGNQAVGRGFYEAGGHVAASYPGSPTVGVVESIKKDYTELYAEFSVNEKVAMEVGIGASFAGARTLVSMKHVGVNIAADPLMTFTQTKIGGGFVLLSGDDPGMASSQNEQDNRCVAKFANMPVFDPGNSQEALDFTKVALDISEKFITPAMVRMTSRVCHSRSVVQLSERTDHEIGGFPDTPENFCMIPPNTFVRQFAMQKRIDELTVYANDMEINTYTPSRSGSKEVLIVTSGLMYYNFMELGLDFSVFKLGMVYPLPIKTLHALSREYKRVIVIEEMTPFIENELKIHNIQCEGKRFFSFTGELNTEDIEDGLFNAKIINEHKYRTEEPTTDIARIPMFCSGCPHRPVFDVLKKEKARVIGDIGCYSLAYLEPFSGLSSIISMGASIGIMKGMSKANKLAGNSVPLACVIGDGTFFHSGMTGMLNMLHQMDEMQNMTVIILNNGTTAMTGGQPTATTKAYSAAGDLDVKIEDLLESMGFDAIQIVDQFDYKNAKKVIGDALKHEGFSIVMTTRPCALNFKIKETPFYVDPSICIGCRSCVKTNCPPILMKEYEGYDKLKSSINKDLCVGCSVCAQVCPVGAIKRIEEEA